MKPHLLDMTIDQLHRAVKDANLPVFRADQLADWVYNKGVTDPAGMTNLPDAVAQKFDILTSRVITQTRSEDNCTKLALELHDGQIIETVLIPSARRATACVSTQAGCAIGCAFCASGIGGLKRNLSAAEILEQILHLRHATGAPVTNVVFMGMGEPLANYDAVLSAVRAIIDPRRFGISARRVTISTVGLPNQIRRLAGEDLPITLAISLHAPNDAVRRRLIPTAEKFTIEEIIAAAKCFYDSRNREITLEYVLLAGVNDSLPCADALAEIARSLRCNVNLIVYNPVEHLPYQSPSPAVVKAFAHKLSARGVNAHLRQPRGKDADAACGQLKRRIYPDGDNQDRDE